MKQPFIGTTIGAVIAKEVVGRTIDHLRRSPNSNVSGQDTIVIADRVIKEVAPEVNAQVNHATNNEPWYQSRVTVGALVSIATAVLAIAGITIRPEDAELIIATGIAVGTIGGNIYTLYGRYVAKKPIGK